MRATGNERALPYRAPAPQPGARVERGVTKIKPGITQVYTQREWGGQIFESDEGVLLKSDFRLNGLPKSAIL